MVQQPCRQQCQDQCRPVHLKLRGLAVECWGKLQLRVQSQLCSMHVCCILPWQIGLSAKMGVSASPEVQGEPPELVCPSGKARSKVQRGRENKGLDGTVQQLQRALYIPHAVSSQGLFSHNVLQHYYALGANLCAAQAHTSFEDVPPQSHMTTTTCTAVRTLHDTSACM